MFLSTRKKKNDCQQGPHNFWQRITLLICLNTITWKEVLNWSRCVPIWGGKRVKSICASSFFNSDVIHRHSRNALPRGITCLMYLACTHFLLPKLFNGFHYQYVWAAHHYMSISNMFFIYLFICKFLSYEDTKFKELGSQTWLTVLVSMKEEKSRWNGNWIELSSLQGRIY